MKAQYVLLVIPFLTLVTKSSGQGATADRNAPPIMFEHITANEGLPDNNIMTIAQDHLGFLWFGTWNGLVRYDGNEFKTNLPKFNSPNSISSRIITCILEDKQGRLWIGTSDGLNQYQFESEDFVQIRISDNNPHEKKDERINALHEDSHGNIWIGGSSGLKKLDPNTLTFTHYAYGLSDDVSGGYNEITSVCEDKSGNIIVGTLKGLCRVDTQRIGYFPFLKELTTQAPFSHEWIKSLYYDDDILWIGTFNGLVRHDFRRGTSRTFLHDSQSSGNTVGNIINAIYKDSDNSLWAGTSLRGINKYEPEKEGFMSYQYDPNNPNSVSGNWVLSIHQDRSGMLWFGCWGDGLNKFNPYKRKFIHINRIPNNSTTLSSNRVFSIRQDSKGFVWVGTDGGGLNQFDPKTRNIAIVKNNPHDPSSISSDIVSCVYEDRSHTIWIGTRNGLNKLIPSASEGGSPTFRHYIHDPLDSTTISADYVQTILEDSQGTLWIGTLGGGLNTLTKREANRPRPRFYRYQYNPRDSNSFDYSRVVSIYEDRFGTIWIGTDGRGLKRYNPSTNDFQHFSDHSTGFDEVSCIYEDSFGRMWVGTYTGGLHLFDRKTGQREIISEVDGLPSNAIKGILEDGDHNLWISTERGLSKFNYNAKTFRNYKVSDGLQSTRFNTNVACKSHDGLLYFGGMNGFNIVDPKNIHDNPFPPQVVLTNIAIFNASLSIGGDSPLKQSLNVAQHIELSYWENDISVGFSALHFGMPQENLYSYKLENYETAWRPAGMSRQARYTNLDPGEYTFRVKAANDDGVWNEQGTSLRIVVTPPFWQTWIFRICLGVALLTTLTVLHKSRISKLESTKRELESQIKDKIEAAKTLQDALNEVDKLKDRLQKENVYLQDEIKDFHNFENIITQNVSFKKVLGSIEKVAATDATLLILGETGTGKELVARAVHNISGRSDRPLVKVDCTTLPANLIESELFGHEKGAFTGAITQKVGRFEMADGGTIFLDEIGDLPLELQAKLLRVLQERECERLGGTKTIKVDVRVIAATNRDLEKETKQGVFREDLFYRLNVFPIKILPLRERKDDIPLLVNYFIKKHSVKIGKNIEMVSRHLIHTLQSYDWPGNVRELESIIERAVIVSPSKKLMLGDWFSMNTIKSNGTHITTLEERERSHILEVLEMTGWRVSGEKGAAKLLGLKPTTLEFRMKKLGIARKA